MAKKVQASLVIPVYNSKKTAVEQLKICQKLLHDICDNYEIIVADDKSTDTTARRLRSNFANNKHFKLLLNKENKGIAKNAQDLYYKAKYEYIIFYSIDGDWNPLDVKKMLMYAVKTQADIVVGKRTKKEGYSFYRNLVSFFHNFLPLLIFGVETYDAGSIKVFRKELIYSIPIVSKSVFFDAEMIIRAKKRGYKIEPYPVEYKKIVKRSGAAGRFPLLLSSLKDLIRLKMSKL